jgi:hypothetical protein
MNARRNGWGPLLRQDLSNLHRTIYLRVNPPCSRTDEELVYLTAPSCIHALLTSVHLEPESLILALMRSHLSEEETVCEMRRKAMRRGAGELDPVTHTYLHT